jgi:hypothetical protein
MGRRSQIVDRALLLRTIASINTETFASAKRIAEELRIPQEDARSLAMDEVRAGSLEIRYAELKHKFVYYVLRSAGDVAEAVA